MATFDEPHWDGIDSWEYPLVHVIDENDDVYNDHAHERWFSGCGKNNEARKAKLATALQEMNTTLESFLIYFNEAAVSMTKVRKHRAETRVGSIHSLCRLGHLLFRTSFQYTRFFGAIAK